METAGTKLAVHDKFQELGEKLGWFKHKSLHSAVQSLTSSAKKRSARQRTKRKDLHLDISKDAQHSKPSNVGKNLVKNSSAKDVNRSPAQTCLAKALSFDFSLSSDSETSFCKDENAGNNKKAVLLVSQEADKESVSQQVLEVKNIEKTFADNAYHLKKQSINIVEASCRNDYNLYGYSYDETVVKGRVSLASCTLDLDSLGEPLIESTRIYRSSDRYKHSLSDNESSGDLTEHIDIHDLALTPNRHVDRKPDDGEYLDKLIDVKADLKWEDLTGKFQDMNCYSPINTLISPSNVTRYVTAIDNFDNLSITTCSEDDDLKNSTWRHNDKFKTAEILKNDGQIDFGAGETEDIVEVIDAETESDDVNGIVSEVYTDQTLYKHQLLNSNIEVKKVPGIELNFAANCTKGKDSVSKLLSEMETIGSSEIDTNTNNNKTCIHCDEQENKNSSDDTQPDCHVPATSKFMDFVYKTPTDVESLRKQTIVLESKSGKDNDQLCDNISESEINEFTERESYSKSDTSDVFLDIRLDSDKSEIFVEIRDVSTQTENAGINVINSEWECNNDDSFANSFKSIPNIQENVAKISHNLQQNSEVKYKLSYKGVGRSESPNERNSEIMHTDKQDEVKVDACDNNCESNNIDKSCDNQDDESADNSVTSLSDATCQAKRPHKNKISFDDKRENLSKPNYRTSTKYSSDSSSEDDLQTFFQKMKTPKRIAPSHSPKSMEDFIVEDGEMTSESDDSVFDLKTSHKSKNTTNEERLTVKSYTKTDDEGFSSKIYPACVTRHKIATKAKSLSLDISSDSESKESESESEERLGKSKESQNESEERLSNNTSSELDFELPNSNVIKVFEDDALVDNLAMKKNEYTDQGNGSKFPSQSTISVHNLLDSNNKLLFITPNPVTKKKYINETIKENIPVLQSVRKLPKLVYAGYSSDDSTDSDLDFITTPKIHIQSNKDVIRSNILKDSNKTPECLGKTPSMMIRQSQFTTSVTPKGHLRYSFLRSLSNVTEDSRRHPDAIKFVKMFKKNKEELSSHLFKLYNETIFDKKLPADMPVLWNKRLLRTAGLCAYLKKTKDHLRLTRIELSTKVCDSAERVRDTLIHEMCHAAVWLVNGVNGGHGPYWKYWARQANKVHTELPAICRCHSYSINTKFTYKCTRCGYCIGRHSKSLDVTKKVCGYCRGTFELVPNPRTATPNSASSSVPATPKTPNRFAIFVKENYSCVKKQNKDLKHGDVMKELSKLFADSKLA